MAHAGSNSTEAGGVEAAGEARPGAGGAGRLWARLEAAWERLVAPAAGIQGPDQRRQARLLTTFLLVALALGVGSDLVVAAASGTLPFTVYPESAPIYAAVALLYALSRTRHTRLAAALSILVTAAGVFTSGLANPGSIEAGFMDFLAVPLLLASMFLTPRQTLALLGLLLAGLLAIPLLIPEITHYIVVIGPMTFVTVSGLLIIVTAWHRLRLEADRRGQLEESEARHRTLVEQLPAITYLDAVDASSPTGFRSLYLSPQFERLLGYTVAEYQSDPRLWYTFIHPDDAARVAAEDSRHFSSRAPSVQEYRLVARDGRVLWVRDEARVRRDEASGAVLTQGVLLDITERVLAEQRSRREAERATALLRIAGRLNAQLDLEALLLALCEECASAFGAPMALVALLDEPADLLRPAAAVGLPPGALQRAAPVRRETHEDAAGGLETVWVAGDQEAGATGAALAEAWRGLGARAAATASMTYAGALIGSLTVLAPAPRDFGDDDRLLLKGLADQAGLAIVNTRLYKDAQRRLEQLQAQRAIDLVISTSTNLRLTLDVLLDQISRQLNVDAAVVLLLNGPTRMLEFAAGRGFRTQALRRTRLRLGDGMAGRAALERRTLGGTGLDRDPGSFTYAPQFAQEGFQTYFATPLVAKGEVKGVLEVFQRSALEPDPEWLSFLEALAGQAAIGIDNAELFEGLQRANLELSLAYDATIEGWSHALDLRDQETEGHTRRVMETTLRLAEHVGGFTDGEMVHLRRGALLHDIGKMGIPDSILRKPGPLTEAEWAIMRRHPTYAYEMLAPIAYLRPALDIPYCHHEKWDGTGYPRGLKGEAIPLAARLFAVVDVWDALLSDRPYRRAWTREQTVAHIAALSGSHFEPRAAAAFLALMDAR
jgi:PAS domain S-box-containing protein